MKSGYIAALLSSIALVAVTAYFKFSGGKSIEKPLTEKESEEQDAKNSIKWSDDASLVGLKWKDDLNRLHPNVRLPHVKHGGTALHLFAEVGYPKCLQFLIDYGYDRNIKNYKGQTPADVARQYGHMDIAKMLETYTSDPLTVEKMKEDKRKKMNEYKPETEFVDDTSGELGAPLLEALFKFYTEEIQKKPK